jgi:hypothetical protein
MIEDIKNLAYHVQHVNKEKLTGGAKKALSSE